MSWPAVVLWILIGVGFFSRGPWLLYILNVSAVFGSLQMLPGAGSGGITILPQSVAAVAFVAKVLLVPGNVPRAMGVAIDLRRLGLMTAFVLYALLTAFVLPRLFSGWIEVVPLSSVGRSQLVPSGGNITQSCYLLFSFGTMVAAALVGAHPEGHRHFFWSLVVTGVALVATGLLDLLTFRLGLSGLLDPFRTANYSLLIDGEINGTKRMVGLCPEASAFGSLCVTTLTAIALLRASFTKGATRALVSALVMTLIAVVALSTSSGAYLGLSVFLAVYGLRLIGTGAFGRTGVRHKALSEIAGVSLIVAAVLVVFLLDPSLLDPASDMIDRVIFQKTSSSSYVERTMWTQTGWNAFIDSAGIGAGFGSIRSSNWFVSVLAGTGLFGGALVFGFILYLFVFPLRRQRASVRRIAQSYRLALPPIFLMAALGGAIPDFGVVISLLFGFLPTLARERNRLDLAPAADSVARWAEPTGATL